MKILKTLKVACCVSCLFFHINEQMQCLIGPPRVVREQKNKRVCLTLAGALAD